MWKLPGHLHVEKVRSTTGACCIFLKYVASLLQGPACLHPGKSCGGVNPAPAPFFVSTSLLIDLQWTQVYHIICG